MSAILLSLSVLAFPVQAFDRYTAHGGPVRDLTISPDGSMLVSASFDYSAVVWTAPQITEKSTLYAHEAAVNTARFSPDGKLLATAGDDGRIYLWKKNVLADEDPEPIILSGHKGKVVNLAFPMMAAYWHRQAGTVRSAYGGWIAVLKRRPRTAASSLVMTGR